LPPASDSSGDRDQNKATARILAALSAFASDLPGYGVTELSNLLGMTKNMVYRALTTLVEQGYLVRDASGQRYQLGYRILELHSAATTEPDLRALCAPFIERVFALTGETVSLMIRSLDYAVFIDGMETRRSGTYRMPIGGLLPLHAPAAGRVMLAFSPDEEIRAYIARHKPLMLPALGTALPVDALWHEIAQIRARGHARVERPGALPMLAIAFPIWGAENRLHGALATGGPQERFAPALDLILPELQEILADLSSRTRLYSADPGRWEMG
jgi:IclR family acetate operon transcriptional repressor